MAADAWIDARVVDQRRWSDGLYSIEIAAGAVDFEAGQFTRLALPIDGQLVARPYSFVNAPGEDHCEFYYGVVPGGPLTARLPQLAPGDTLRVSRQPSGFMVLSELPDAEQLWLISTGTGIGPFLSILATPAPWQRFGRVVLAHGVRQRSELVYAERIAALRTQHGERFRFIPLLSRDRVEGPASAAGAAALAGRVTQALADGGLEHAAGLELSAAPGRAQVMLCGNPAMVSEATELLKGRGMKKHRRRDPGQITVENYW